MHYCLLGMLMRCRCDRSVVVDIYSKISTSARTLRVSSLLRELVPSLNILWDSIDARCSRLDSYTGGIWFFLRDNLAVRVYRLALA